MKIGVIYNIAQDVFRSPALDLESDAEMKLIPQLEQCWRVHMERL